MADTDILTILDTLEPDVSKIRGDLRKIADVHIQFYKFYIRFASHCDALLFDKKSRDYLESCVNFLENKKLSSKAINQSRSNCLKMLDSLNDLCITLGGDKNMFSPLHKMIELAVVEEAETEKSDGGGTMDLLKQLKSLLNEEVEDDPKFQVEPTDTGRVSPANSSSSSDPETGTSKMHGGVESMAHYLLSDSGMDGYSHNHFKELKNIAFTSEMNNIAAKASALRENTYSTLDRGIAMLKTNVPLWNYNLDRLDSINSNNVIDNMEIFRGNQSVIDAVLYSCPQLLTVGPFDVYLRNRVFVYHCMVNNCNDCMTTSLEFLKLHVKFSHGEYHGDWNCTFCDLIKLHSECQKSLDGALDHLAKYHSSKSTYALSHERLSEINKKISEDDETPVCPITSDEMTSEENIDLFHCPVAECKFSTNSPSVSFGHFATISDEYVSFHCRYCPLVSYNKYWLTDHLVNEHGNARYKCGYCPYRTVSKANAVFHQRDVHSGLPNKIFGLEPLPGASYKYDCRAHNTIKPFVCRLDCNFSSLVERQFNNHLLGHQGADITCHYCQEYESSDISDLRDHLLLHGVGEYHCLYCKEAFNFIARIERHLHEKHSSQYPFIIICQEYDARSLSLKGKYRKIQKLDIGQDSIIVLPIDSDVSICRTEIISKSDSILVDDIDHCKMQLKTFLKNKEEPEAIVPVIEPVRIEETLDLTQTDERERADIKPRLRVRTIEELMKSTHLPDPRTEKDDGMFSETDAGFGLPAVHTENPLPSGIDHVEDDIPILTPAQIKKEIFGGNVNQPAIEEPPQPCIDDIDTTETILIPSAQIKREVEVSKKVAAPSVERTINIKQEMIENMESRGNVAQPTENHPETYWERNEDNEAAAIIAQQVEADRLASPSAKVRVVNVPQIAKKIPTPCPVATVQAPAEIVPSVVQSVTKELTKSLGSPVLVKILGFVPDMTAQLNPITVAKEVMPIATKVQGDGRVEPILPASSIVNVPVELDCELPQLVNQDSKMFTVDKDGNLRRKPMPYKEPTVVDTVIISDGEDEYDDIGSPRSSSSQRVESPFGAVLPSTSASASSTSATYDTPKQPTANPIETKKYRCKLCKFTSDRRETTYDHLYAAHPLSLNDRVRQRAVADAVPGDLLVDAVSCPYCIDKVYEGIKSFERHHVLAHGDFSEIKCFFFFSKLRKQHPQQIFACNFCGHFCLNEDSVWEHTYKSHNARISNFKRPLQLNLIVALKKMVCPLYNCLEEFLDPVSFREHVDSHQTVIACKTCTYIADTVEAFQEHHNELDPVERLTHFYYPKSKEDRASLIHVQRFSNPLYSLNHVICKEKFPASVNKTTARKSTGPPPVVQHKQVF